MVKIGCIRLVWSGAKKYKFSFFQSTGPLSCFGAFFILNELEIGYIFLQRITNFD